MPEDFTRNLKGCRGAGGKDVDIHSRGCLEDGLELCRAAEWQLQLQMTGTWVHIKRRIKVVRLGARGEIG